MYHDTSKCTFTNFIEIYSLVLRLCIVVTDKCVDVLNNISIRNADIWPECFKMSVKNFTSPLTTVRFVPHIPVTGDMWCIMTHQNVYVYQLKYFCILYHAMCTVNNAGELGKTVCPNLNGVAATILVAPRPTIFASQRGRWGVIDEAAIMATDMGENLRLTTTLMDWPVCHENIQLWHMNCCNTCRKYEYISSNNVRIGVFGRHF